jgi:PLD-like domain
LTGTSAASVTVKAYVGDAKTLLAFNLAAAQAKQLAGFTIESRPPSGAPYYLHNTLRFQNPGAHAQVPSEPPNSSVNAPFHKFRWLHVPGSVHQGLSPVFGTYTYGVTPRYFDDTGSMRTLDPSNTSLVEVHVGPFASPGIELGFTRGYVQSQAFVNHFGPKALIRPSGAELLFDTSQPSGTNAAGTPYTYADEYEWLGFTAREKIFAVLEEVRGNPDLRLDMFAYDLNEPDILKILLELAAQGRVRVILDDAALHHSTKTPMPEDQFQSSFEAAARAPAAIIRGHFGRYAHDKVLIVSAGDSVQKVLTGSTNFSVTGLYVNSNHVLVFGPGAVAAKYAEMFTTVWGQQAKRPAYLSSPLSGEKFTADSPLPQTSITFAPHADQFATSILDAVAARIEHEGSAGARVGSVLFAVMQIDKGTSPVYTALNNLHADQSIFSMGISDSPSGISLYTPGQRTGVLVTGKPGPSQLPPPFNQVPGVGPGHQIHHKFVVCGFAGPEPVVYCGSSNLAVGGEEQNGDNLLEIHDPDVVTAFAIEALALVDHFQFLNRLAAVRTAPGAPAAPAPAGAAAPAAAAPAAVATTTPPADKQAAAASAGWFLSTDDKWALPYFDPADLHCVDRELFGG